MSAISLISLLAKMPCGGHGTANSVIKPCSASLRSTNGLDASHNLRASS